MTVDEAPVKKAYGSILLRAFTDVRGAAGCSTQDMDTTASGRICELQAMCGIEQACAEDCLYFERSGSPVVGCLYKDADVTRLPKTIVRQLLKAAGRKSK